VSPDQWQFTLEWELMIRRTEWNSKIAQTPPTVEYKGIMAENGQGENGVLSVLEKVVSGLYWCFN